MTADAVTPRVPKSGCRMAAFAGCQHVAAIERKTGLIVIKLVQFPALIVVTTLTVRADLTFMLIVFFVTGKASHRCVTKTLPVFVTSVALHSRCAMGIAQ